MLLLGGRGIQFRYGEFTCLLNDVFNLVLFTDYTAFYMDEAHPVGFVIPVKYLSFIKSMNRKFSLNTDLEEIFQFENDADKCKLEEYVSKLDDESFSIIPDLRSNKKAAIWSAYKSCIRTRWKRKHRTVQ